VLVVTPPKDNEQLPILLYLHGRDEASPFSSKLPLVCVHHSPPFQALLGRLSGAVIVAPQAPYEGKSGWDWAPILPGIQAFLTARFAARPRFAVGFSRGGRGVLQLLRSSEPQITRWAVIDPQPSPEALPLHDSDPPGWLAYGPQFDTIQAFSEGLAKSLPQARVRATAHQHGPLARLAFDGNALGGNGNLYDFLGLSFI
jgi:hypothetical protein